MVSDSFNQQCWLHFIIGELLPSESEESYLVPLTSPLVSHILLDRFNFCDVNIPKKTTRKTYDITYIIWQKFNFKCFQNTIHLKFPINPKAKEINFNNVNGVYPSFIFSIQVFRCSVVEHTQLAPCKDEDIVHGLVTDNNKYDFLINNIPILAKVYINICKYLKTNPSFCVVHEFLILQKPLNWQKRKMQHTRLSCKSYKTYKKVLYVADKDIARFILLFSIFSLSLTFCLSWFLICTCLLMFIHNNLFNRKDGLFLLHGIRRSGDTLSTFILWHWIMVNQ